MNKKEEFALGIDCGGTNIKLALVSRSAKIIASSLEPIDYHEQPKNVVEKISNLIKRFLKKHSEQPVKTIGIGIAGDVDQKAGLVRFSPNLNWKNVPLKDFLHKNIRTDILIENDANCAAWGAYCLDSNKDCNHLVCLTLGTGIGGGVIVHSKLYRGATGSAGEIGHMTIRYDGRPCKCGSFGCAESYLGAWGLIQTAEEGLKKNLSPILKRLLQRSPKNILNPKLLQEAAKAGDPYCQQFWKDAGEQLGSLLASCVNIFNPDRIILCGGVSKAGPLLLDPALQTLGRRAFAIPAKKVNVTISKYDEWLGVAGAALLALEP